MAKNKGLGKGLDALFSQSDISIINNNDADSPVKLVRLSDIEPDKEQPRKLFDEASLTSLAESIERHGILQPLVVRKAKADANDTGFKLSSDKYTIISGERRWRAAKMASLTEVPVIVKDLSDTDVAAIMLVENLQREDLNPVELALGLKRLCDEFGLTQEETASIVGISRPALANSLRLLSLPDEALDSLANGDISAGHGRALLGLSDSDLIQSALQKVVAKSLSVRETEKLVKDILKENEPKQAALDDDDILKAKRAMQIYISKLEEKVGADIGRKVTISSDSKKPECGKLVIEYYSSIDLEELLKKMCSPGIFTEE